MYKYLYMYELCIKKKRIKTMLIKKSCVQLFLKDQNT